MAQPSRSPEKTIFLKPPSGKPPSASEIIHRPPEREKIPLSFASHTVRAGETVRYRNGPAGNPSAAPYEFQLSPSYRKTPLWVATHNIRSSPAIATMESMNATL